jgi:PAS domain S-box-containing protein
VGLGSSLVAAILAGQMAARDLEADTLRQATGLARIVRERLEDGLAERYREISIAAAMLSTLDPLIEGARSEDVRRAWLARMTEGNADYAWLGVADREGRVLVAAGGLLEGKSVAERDWFKAALGGPVVGDVHEAKLLASLLPRAHEDEPLRFVDVAAPVLDREGRVAGVLGAHLNWNWARSVARRALDDEGGAAGRHLYVVGRDGRVLLEPLGPAARLAPGPERLSAALAQGRPTVAGADGRLLLVGASPPVPGAQGPTLGWTVVVLEDAVAALAPAKALGARIVLAGALVGAVLAALGWLLGGFLSAPLVGLADAVRRFGSSGGEFRLRPAGTAEIQTLSESVGGLARELRAREDTLRGLNATLEQRVAERTLALEASGARLAEREAELRALFDNVADGILTADEGGTILTCNPGAERIFGLPAAEIVGRGVHALLPGAFPAGADAFAAPAAPIGGEVEGERGDGSPFFVDLSFTPMRVGGERRFVGIVRDITGRKEAERAKAEFVSTVSHELRTPLTSIAGSLGLLAGGVAGQLPDKAQSLLGIARKNSERLVSLINDILDIEKIDSGRLEFRLQELDLAQLASQAVEQDRPFAERLGVALEFRAEEGEGPRVMADPARIGQVLANLISNAAKFSPSGAVVTVSVATRGGLARVSVEDRGTGIPEAFRPRIFQRFAQADSSDTRRIGGTGLGLSIARGIAERHGGTLGFESEEGVGTTFHLDLPLAIREAPSEAPVRVLICEDDPDIAQLLRLVVAQDGFAADIAGTAAEAERLLAERDYAALTLDLNLPDRSGLELARALRADPRTAALPVVVVSGKAAEAAAAEAEAAEAEAEAADGASDAPRGAEFRILDWLGKPIDMDRLLQSIRDAVHGRRDGLPEVLHVEDDPDTLQLVDLVMNGIARVVPASTLAEARARLDAGRFDLMLLDLALPDGSGLELLPYLDERAGRPLPVVVFSAMDVDRATAARVERALTKSRTDIAELVAAVRSVLDRNPSAFAGPHAHAPEPVHAP